VKQLWRRNINQQSSALSGSSGAFQRMYTSFTNLSCPICSCPSLLSPAADQTRSMSAVKQGRQEVSFPKETIGLSSPNKVHHRHVVKVHHRVPSSAPRGSSLPFPLSLPRVLFSTAFTYVPDLTDELKHFSLSIPFSLIYPSLARFTGNGHSQINSVFKFNFEAPLPQKT